MTAISYSTVSTYKHPNEEVERAILEIRESSFDRFYQRVKRLSDCITASILVLCLSPVFLLIAILVKWTSPGPIFYRSLRLGKNRRPFCMLKFRTMRQNADYFIRPQSTSYIKLTKLKNDPRITPLGRWLRPFNLDELPQLFNVLKGDMSLTGPGALTPDDYFQLNPPVTNRFKTLPGMIHLWSASQ